MSEFPGLSPAEIERLAILLEESAEVIQVAGKILRFGYESKNPLVFQEKTNRELLENELGDLRGIQNLMVRAGDIDQSRIDVFALLKEAKIPQWSHHQSE